MLKFYTPAQNKSQVIERNVSFENPAIAKHVAALDKEFGLTYYPEKSEPLMEKYGLS